MNVSPEVRDKILGMATTIDGKPVDRLSSAKLAEKISEKEFMAEVVIAAKYHGWKVYHTYNSRKSEAGFPDLALLKDRLIVAELKARDGRLTAAQANWLDAFRSARVETYEWRPDQWTEIVAVLSGTLRTTPPPHSSEAGPEETRIADQASLPASYQAEQGPDLKCRESTMTDA